MSLKMLFSRSAVVGSFRVGNSAARTTAARRPLSFVILPNTQFGATTLSSASKTTLLGTEARPYLSHAGYQPPHCFVRQYWSSSTAKRSLSTSSSTPNNEDEDDADAESAPPTPKVIYAAPMGNLVTRLKRVSITSCLVGIIGLPTLIYLKNGGWPDMKQIGVGGFAFFSGAGTTLALHFVFGPYVLELSEIPVRKCLNEGEQEEDGSPPQNERERAAQEYLLQATTRSIFGFKRNVVFDPLTDVTKFAGVRPFANFVVKDEFVLYCHPELLDEDMRRKLLHPKESNKQVEEAEKKLKKELNQIRRPADEEDGFI
jgi:hypothetical protein